MKNNLTYYLVMFWYMISSLQMTAQSIEGKVFIDYNSNGKPDQNEPTNDGVFVTLFKKTQNNLIPVDSIKTDSAGYYKFEDFGLGYYWVTFDYEGFIKPSMVSYPNCDFYLDSISQKEVCNMSPVIPNCTSNPYSVDNLCELAYSNPLCELTVIGDFPCGQNPSILGPWNDSLHCGGKFQNTSFYGFVAGTGNYAIEINIFSCAGAGIEYGIMDSCDPNGPYVVCNSLSNTGTIVITNTSLIPGKTYVLWIDGYQGSVCSYYIRVVGDFNAFTIPDIHDIKVQGLSETTCNPAGNYTINFELEPGDTFAKENVSAFWEVQRPDGEIEKFTTYTDRFDTLSYYFHQTGNYEICVTTYNLCSLSSPIICKEFEINVKQSEPPIEIVKKDFCLNEEPFIIEALHTLTGNVLQNVMWSGIGIDSLGFFDPSLAGIGTHQIYFQVLIDSCLYEDTTSIVVRDANVGDNCDDGDPETIDDMIQDDCQCRGVLEDGISDTETWYYTPFGLTPSAEIWKVQVVGDTIVKFDDFNQNGAAQRNGIAQKFKIIAIDKGQGIIEESKIPIARVDDKLYFYENGKQKLYFDFTKGENDTMIYFVPQVQPYYDISSNKGFTKPDSISYSLIVNSIMEVSSTEGIKLHKVYTHAINGHHAGDNIQIVGGNIGFFGAFGPFLAAGFDGYLRCFQSDVLNYNPSSIECLSTSTADESLDKPKIYILPNPASSEFSVYSEENGVLDLQILNSNGVSIHNQLFLNNVSIDVTTWASGIYYVFVKTKNAVTALKFIKVE